MSGLLQIFTNPAHVFAEIRDNRKGWVLPFFAYLCLFFVSFVTVVEMIGWENINRKQIERRGAQLTPEQAEKQLQVASSPTVKRISYATTPLFAGVGLLLVAGIFMGMLMVMDSSPGYRRVLAATSYSSWALGLVSLVFSLLILGVMSDRREADPRHLLMFNLGAFMDQNTTSPALYSLASSFDLLTLAYLALLGYGLSIVSGRISFGKAFAGLAVLWLVWILLKAGFAVAFPMFG